MRIQRQYLSFIYVVITVEKASTSSFTRLRGRVLWTFSMVTDSPNTHFFVETRQNINVKKQDLSEMSKPTECVGIDQ